MADFGATANSYQVLGKLAVGGMAEIFLVRSVAMTGVDRYCVLKRILPEHAANAQFIQMFLDEARLATQLQHPNIASVYDIGTLGDSYFYTMEYVHGETIRSLVERVQELGRPLPVACVMTTIAGVAAALHHAHERRAPDGRPLGIVHRDVSPSNVMVSYEGNVKLVDFGVAKAANRIVETKTGTVKGKISYLSPEQCHGERVDRRSDLFSLGIVMWEMLTGTRLYRRASDFDNMAAIVQELPARPSTQRPEVPSAIDAIVLRLLAKSPADRFQTAAELVEAIENASVRAGTMLSTAAVSRLLRDLFGVRPEPWLALDRAPQKVTTVRLVLQPVPDDPDDPDDPDEAGAGSSQGSVGSTLRFTRAYVLTSSDGVDAVSLEAGPHGGPATVSIDVSASIPLFEPARPPAPTVAWRAAIDPAPGALHEGPTLRGVSPASASLATARGSQPEVHAGPIDSGAVPVATVAGTPRAGLRSPVVWLVAAVVVVAVVVGWTAARTAVPVTPAPVAAAPVAPATVAAAPIAAAPAPVADVVAPAVTTAVAPPGAGAVDRSTPARAAIAPDTVGSQPAPDADDDPPVDPAPSAAAPPRRSVASTDPARRPRSARARIESIQSLYDAGRYPRVVAACGETSVTAATAVICTLAACQVHDNSKAQRWLSLAGDGARGELVDECARLGAQAVRRPTLDCAKDPLDCR